MFISKKKCILIILLFSWVKRFLVFAALKSLDILYPWFDFGFWWDSWDTIWRPKSSDWGLLEREARVRDDKRHCGLGIYVCMQMSRFPASLSAALHRKCQVVYDDSTSASARLDSIVLVWFATTVCGTPARQIEMLIWKTYRRLLPLSSEVRLYLLYIGCKYSWGTKRAFSSAPSILYS